MPPPDDDPAPLSAKQRALLAERLRARDAAVVKAALDEVARLRARALIPKVVALLGHPRAGTVIDALQTLGSLGAADELDRAEARLAPAYGGWIAVARQRLASRPAR
jgi:hypothetical protein